MSGDHGEVQVSSLLVELSLEGVSQGLVEWVLDTLESHGIRVASQLQEGALVVLLFGVGVEAGAVHYLEEELFDFVGESVHLDVEAVSAYW